MRKAKEILLTIIMALLALTIPGIGQEQAPVQSNATQEQVRKYGHEEWVRKVIQLKYAEPSHIADLLKDFGANLRSDNRSKALTVVGRPDAVAAVEGAVAKLDVPPAPAKDADLTAYFVLASREPVQAADVPPELGEVVTQLKRVLNYKNFQLLSTAFLRSRDGAGAAVQGVARIGTEAVSFRLTFREANIIPEGKVQMVRIEGLNFTTEQGQPTVPHGEGQTTQGYSARILTDIDVAEGQKVVVGKTSLDMPDNALVLVLTAKVTD